MEKINTECCDKKMIELQVCNVSSFTDMETKRFFCGECGKFIDINTYNLDDEELINYFENDDEEFKETKIYKELMK